MNVFLNLHADLVNLDNSTDKYKSVFKTKEIIENVFFEYSGCNYQVALNLLGEQWCLLFGSMHNILIDFLSMSQFDCHLI